MEDQYFVNADHSPTPLFAGRKTVVVWDPENTPIPAGFPPSQVRARLISTLWTLGYTGMIKFIATAANYDRLPLEKVGEMKQNGLSVQILHVTEKQAADWRLLQRLNYFWAPYN